MSLINKMLKDLETRQAAGGRGERLIFQNLQPVHEPRRSLRWVLMSAMLLAVLGGGYYTWRQNAVPVPQANVAAPVPLAMQTEPALQPQTPAVVAEAAPAAPVAVDPVPAPRPAPKPVVRPKPNKASEPAARPAQVAARQSRPQPRKADPAVTSPEAGPSAPGRIEKTERPYTPEEQAEAAYREAANLRVQGNASEAERRLRVLLATHPKHIKARESLAGLQLESGRWLEAQDTLEQGIRQVPGHLAFRYLLARLHLEHGNAAQAIQLLEQARSEGRSDAELHGFLAALYQRNSRHADAVKSYQEALQLSPQEGRWWLGMGISQEALQNAAAARDSFQRALETGRLAANLAGYAEERLKALAAR